MFKITALHVIDELGPKFMEFLKKNQLVEFVTDPAGYLDEKTVIGTIFSLAYGNGVHSSQFEECSKRLVSLLGGHVPEELVDEILSQALGYRDRAQLRSKAVKLKFKSRTYYYPSVWRHGMTGRKQIFEPDSIAPIDVKVKVIDFWALFQERGYEDQPTTYYTPVDYMVKVAFHYNQCRKTLKECARDMQILSSGQLTLGDSYRLLAKAMGYESWYHAKVSSAPDENIENLRNPRPSIGVYAQH